MQASLQKKLKKSWIAAFRQQKNRLKAGQMSEENRSLAFYPAAGCFSILRLTL
jgi:hypothetical protein